MKKSAAIILALILTASLAACSGGESSNPKETSSNSAVTTISAEDSKQTIAEETTAQETTDSGELKKNDSGEGEKLLESVFCDVTIPKGLIYKIYSYSYDEDNKGAIQIDFGKSNTMDGRLEVSTTRIINSLDDAANECIRVRNLDSYKDGKSKIGGEKTFNNTTYKEVDISTENGNSTYLVSYYKRADGENIYVELKTTQDNFNDLKIDDPLVEKLLNSVVYK